MIASSRLKLKLLPVQLAAVAQQLSLTSHGRHWNAHEHGRATGGGRPPATVGLGGLGRLPACAARRQRRRPPQRPPWSVARAVSGQHQHQHHQHQHPLARPLRLWEARDTACLRQGKRVATDSRGADKRIATAVTRAALLTDSAQPRHRYKAVGVLCRAWDWCGGRSPLKCGSISSSRSAHSAGRARASLSSAATASTNGAQCWPKSSVPPVCVRARLWAPVFGARNGFPPPGKE